MKPHSPALRLLWLLLTAALALQLYFACRILLMVWVNPESSAFQRSEIFRLGSAPGVFRWRQQWLPYAQLPDSLKRAVIAAEDGSFAGHDGVDFEALEKAWDKNTRAEQKALAAGRARPTPSQPVPPAATQPRIVGGSTITQQLAKNLFLSGERSLLRKGQELVLSLLLEALLSKQRILEIYLNNVEWGEGIFGAEAAARHYFRKSATALSPYEAARLAVMLPRPRYFETRPRSAYLSARASAIAARMGSAQLP